MLLCFIRILDQSFGSSSNISVLFRTQPERLFVFPSQCVFISFIVLLLMVTFQFVDDAL